MSVFETANDSMSEARKHIDSSTDPEAKKDALAAFLLAAGEAIDDLFPDSDDLGDRFVAQQIQNIDAR